MPFTLDALVADAAASRPAAPAVVSDKAVLTYGDLDAAAEQTARQLAAAGVRPGDRVAIYQPKSPETVVALVGILKCGAAYVPIDPGAPAQRARFIIEHCGIDVVFCCGRPWMQLSAAEAERRGRLKTVITADGPRKAKDTNLELLPPGQAPDAVPDLRPPIDRDLAYVLYTSGSTGTPKGVAITHAQSLAFVRGATEVFELRPQDVLTSHAPFNFDLSVIDLFCTFYAQASVVLIPDKWLAFPAKISQLIAERGVTVWNSVPSALMQLSARGNMEGRDLSALRLVMFAGEPYPVKRLRELKAKLPAASLMNVYGQTEANSSTYFRVDEIPEDDTATLPMGRAMPNYDVIVLADTGAPITERGVEGELIVRGGAVASGYYRDPERTAKAFVPHPLVDVVGETVYRTGDRVIRDEEGDLVYRGRADFAIKVRGFRVEPSEVEANAGAYAGVETCALVALPVEEIGHRLVLYVVVAAGAEVSPDAITAHLGHHLPRYMVPDEVHIETSLPVTGTGKIDRNALKARAESGSAL